VEAIWSQRLDQQQLARWRRLVVHVEGGVVAKRRLLISSESGVIARWHLVHVGRKRRAVADIGNTNREEEEHRAHDDKDVFEFDVCEGELHGPSRGGRDVETGRFVPHYCPRGKELQRPRPTEDRTHERPTSTHAKGTIGSTRWKSATLAGMPAETPGPLGNHLHRTLSSQGFPKNATSRYAK